MVPQLKESTRTTGDPSTRRSIYGFVVTALSLLLGIALTAVPTPLYVLYQARNHFSNAALTVVYACYAFGVLASLRFAGHASDTLGRRRVLIPALLLDALSAAIFIAAPTLGGLVVARTISGISVGLITTTATAYLSELDAWRNPLTIGGRAQLVAAVATIGGIGVGPLVAGVLAQYVSAPLITPYAVFALVVVLLSLLVARAPETVQNAGEATPERRLSARPTQLGGHRGMVAAGVVGGVSFAVFGVFNALTPSYLLELLHQTSHAVAGAVVFALFTAGAGLPPMLGQLTATRRLRIGVMFVTVGLCMLVCSLWINTLALFVVSAVTAGAGAGLLFRSALDVAEALTPADDRAAYLSAYFVSAYLGLSVPVIAVGVASDLSSPRGAATGFVILLFTFLATSSRRLLASYASGWA